MDFSYRLLISVPVLFGAILMVFSIMKFRDNIKLLKEFYYKKRFEQTRVIYFHQFMLILFLIGYLITLACFLFDIPFASKIITSIVFFFGALFVYLENKLHRDLLRSIKVSYNETIDISSVLEEEREKLLSANRQLSDTEDVTIFALAYQAEIRDLETGGHITRASEYVKILITELKKIRNSLTISPMNILRKL